MKELCDVPGDVPYFKLTSISVFLCQEMSKSQMREKQYLFHCNKFVLLFYPKVPIVVVVIITTTLPLGFLIIL